MAGKKDLERDGIRPDIEMSDAVLVVIKRPQAPLRAFRDDGTVQDFVAWMMDNRIYPLRSAGGGSGPGFYSGTFDAQDRDAIRGWFRERGFDA